ncbi:beta strand repeat-containing protein [Roseinatronobacter thiooxidans]|nr:hypothetical protein [Roseinatronobacter thiooxidans]
MAQVVNITIDSTVPTPGDAFTAANVTGFDTTANNTQESRAAVTASIAGGALTTSDTGTDGSSVDVTENQFTASAQGNLFTLQTQNLGNVGSGTLGVLTGQFADATVSANITGTDATVTGTAAALQSSLDASNNTLTARTSINQASTVFSDDISADLASQLAQSNQSFAVGTNTPETLTRGNFDAQLLNVTGGGSVVANTQAVAETALASSALIDDSDILIAVTGVATGSALSVDNNELRATLTGNQGVTGTDVSVDTQFNSSAGVFSQQQIGAGAGDVTLSAGVTDSVLAVSLTDATNSSLTVDENVIGAQARGNVATLDGNGLNGLGNEGTFLNVSANDITAAGVAGGVISVDNAGTLSFSDGATASSSFGFLAATQQAVESAANGSITATNSSTALSVSARTVTNSAINVDDNTFFAIASANTGGTGIDLSATSVTASAGLASDQSLINTGVSALLGTSGVPAALTATATLDISDSSITLDDNIFVTEASGNTGRTSLTASADTTLQSSDTNDRGTAALDFTAGTATAAATDFGTIANQSIDANSDINAQGFTSLGVVAGADLDEDDNGNISGSTLSVSDNAQNSTASGNTLTNRIALSGNVVGVEDPADFADNEAVTTSLGSLQQLGSDVTAGSNTNLSITQDGFGSESLTDAIVSSSLLIDGNDNRARATGNTVDSIVSVTADTAIIGADATAATATATTGAPATLTAGGGTTLSTGQFSTGDVISATGVSTAQIAGDDSGDSTRSIVGSTASISDNITTGTAIANIGTSSIVLDAGTELTSNAALAAQQGNSADVTATATSDFGNSALTPLESGIELTGDVANSTLAIDNNTTLGTAMGNIATNALSVTATTIDRADSTAEGSTVLGFTTATTFATGADFAALNLQTQTGDILADVDNFGNVAVVGTLTDSSASLSGNALQGDAMSNDATNRITLDGSAGITDTTTALGSVQTSVGTVGTDLDANFQIVADGLTTSSAAIDGNQGFAAATSNRVVNEVSLSGNSISGEATTFADVGVTLEPQVGSQALADTSLSSVQTSLSGVTTDSTIVGRIGLDTSPVTGSSASVSDNFARAFGMGNEGVNRLGIDADTSFAGTTALTGTQVQIGAVSASALVDADIITDAGASLTGSSAAIDSNVAFARTMGNDQTNALTIDATTISGVSGNGDTGSIVALGDPTLPDPPAVLAVDREFTGDNIVSNFQGLRGDVTGSATVDGEIVIPANILNSSVSASENIAQSNVTGNRGNNLLDLNAATSVTGVSTLASEQGGRAPGAETNIVSSTATLNFDIDQAATTTVTSGALNVDGNVGFSSAFANDVTNRLNVSGTSVVGRNDELSVAGISATGVVSGDADNLLGNFQSRSNEQAVNSTATLTVDLLGSSTPDGTADSLGTSSVSVRDNFLDSTATSNRARNTLVLNADTALTAGGAVVNSQVSDSPVTSDVRLRAGVGSDNFGNVAGSSIALQDNTGIARASGNDAVNVLNARGGTGITGVAGSAGATFGVDAMGDPAPGVLNASGTFAMASNQVNTGAVRARAGFDGTDTESLFEARTGTLTGSSVAIGGNRLVADAVSNRVENRLTVNGSPSSQDVTTAITSRQVATGAVTSRVDSTRLASLNGAVSSSSVGLNGNTLSASAGGNIATTRLIRD